MIGRQGATAGRAGYSERGARGRDYLANALDRNDAVEVERIDPNALVRERRCQAR